MNLNSSNRYLHLTDHELYVAAVRALTGEFSGIAQSRSSGDNLYAECQRRGRLRIWEVALEDSTLKVEATKDNLESKSGRLPLVNQAVNLIRIDFCNDDELMKILRSAGKVERLRDVVELREGYYCSEVMGNSMMNAGICDGDSLIVRRDKRLIDNTVQIVKAAGKYLVKRVVYTNDGVELRSENPSHGVMMFRFGETEGVEPLGVVRWVVKDVR